MKYRLTTLLLAVIFITLATITIAYNNPTGGNAINFERPTEIGISLGFSFCIFLPALILGVFKYKATRIISTVWQILFAVPALFLTLIVIFTTPIPLLVVVLILTTMVIIASAITTLCTE
ncbi:hypothetical protein [Staphylococcus durrellii]|uniref:hypothetical protein n=1 Tax=Staphylococcus durrellii TaxID=2781773 RepID=UPI0018A03C39|nr:hypothetical protein [Staphylococcus durrellii]MBF7017969.1 hypothetical protein [Staphylococcus durrellii]